jgi:hypothetical protein
MKDAWGIKLAKSIGHWANELGISDYKFILNYVSNSSISGDYARVDTDDETREVAIDINRTRLLKEPQEVERTVIHELLHTRFNEYAELLAEIVRNHVDSPKARKTFIRQADKIEHKIVVAITDALDKKYRSRKNNATKQK